jgi:hypothetical protein
MGAYLAFEVCSMSQRQIRVLKLHECRHLVDGWQAAVENVIM